jgi:hypothetical protein
MLVSKEKRTNMKKHEKTVFDDTVDSLVSLMHTPAAAPLQLCIGSSRMGHW